MSEKLDQVILRVLRPAVVHVFSRHGGRRRFV
jgi:hypothetical protein